MPEVVPGAVLDYGKCRELCRIAGKGGAVPIAVPGLLELSETMPEHWKWWNETESSRERYFERK